jgi:hypothetical protein
VFVTGFLVALAPSVGVGFIFWLGIKSLLEADRRERAAQARIEAAERRASNTVGEEHSRSPVAPRAGQAPQPPGDEV